MRLLFILTVLVAAWHWLDAWHRDGWMWFEAASVVGVWIFVGFVLWDSKRLDDNDWWDL